MFAYYRITSYNVCYTKLLRFPDERDNAIHDDPRIIAHHVILYRICNRNPIVVVRVIFSPRPNPGIPGADGRFGLYHQLMLILIWQKWKGYNCLFVWWMMTENLKKNKKWPLGGYVITSYSIHYTKLYELRWVARRCASWIASWVLIVNLSYHMAFTPSGYQYLDMSVYV